jgi:hypothetical protein
MPGNRHRRQQKDECDSVLSKCSSELGCLPYAPDFCQEKIIGPRPRSCVNRAADLRQNR